MFSKTFKELRKKYGYSQREVAEKLNLSKSTIGMYETGQRTPDFKTEELIADFFNVDIDMLRGRKSTTTMILDKHEKFVIEAYRDQPDMQPAVDKLLGVEHDP